MAHPVDDGIQLFKYFRRKYKVFPGQPGGDKLGRKAYGIIRFVVNSRGKSVQKFRGNNQSARQKWFIASLTFKEQDLIPSKEMIRIEYL
jgi:hypothetical protein